MTGLPLVLRNAIATMVVDALSERRFIARLEGLVQALAPGGAALEAALAARLTAGGAFVTAVPGETFVAGGAIVGAAGARSGGRAYEAGRTYADEPTVARGHWRESSTPPSSVRVALAPGLEKARMAAVERATRALAAIEGYWSDIAVEAESTAARTEIAVALRRAAALFAARLFFEVHEVLEAAWNRLDGEPRRFVQGLLQIAVALHHLEHGNATGASSLFEAGRAKLAAHVPEYHGVAVADLLAALEPWERVAHAGGMWPADLELPPMRVR